MQTQEVSMRNTLRVAAICSVITTPLAAQEVFTVGTSPAGESITLYIARDMQWFERRGIRLDIKTVATTDVGTLLVQKVIDAHTFPTEAIPGHNSRRVCSKMVAPLTSRFSQAIVAKVPTWKALDGKQVAVFQQPSFSAGIIEEALERKGVSVQLTTVRFFTAERVNRLLADGGLTATHAANPHAAYLSFVPGMHVLAPPGSEELPQAVLVGFFARCDDLSGDSRDRLQRVVTVLKDFAQWSTTTLAEREVKEWIRAWLIREGHSETEAVFKGMRLVRVVSLDEIVERVYRDHVRTVSPMWPDSQALDATVRFSLGREQRTREFADFYDLTLF